MFFDSWSSLGRTALAGVIAYAALVVFLRISGKRTLAKLNAFDFVVTIAIGSTLASVLTSKSLALADGIVALGLLIALQYVVASLIMHSDAFRRLVKSRPTAVFTKGEYDESAMHKQRVTRDEILMAIRRAGIHDLDEVYMVVLETDGSINVLQFPEQKPQRSSAEDVTGGPGER